MTRRVFHASLLALTLAPAALASPLDGTFGVLIMAHGGDEAWNETVAALVAPLRDEMPVEIAFGMAERGPLQSAVRRLEAAGVGRIAVVRLFIWGDSFLPQTEYLFGLTDEVPRFFMGHQGPEPPARIEHRAQVVLSRVGLVDSPQIGRILRDRVAALSQTPERESVLILAHGLGGEADNAALLAAMDERAREIRDAALYRRVHVDTLREDWAEPREAAEPGSGCSSKRRAPRRAVRSSYRCGSPASGPTLSCWTGWSMLPTALACFLTR